MSSVSSPPSSIIPFLVQQNGNIRLYHIKISDGDFGESCIKRIRALFSDANNVGRRFTERVILAIKMRELVVGTVRVLEVSSMCHQAIQTMSNALIVRRARRTGPGTEAHVQEKEGRRHDEPPPSCAHAGATGNGKFGLGVGGGVLAVLTTVQAAIIMWHMY
jgi:hypothetical protein